MIPTKINREITKQSIMYRIDNMISQLPPKDNMVAICRQTGKKSRIIRVQLLIWEIELAYQQLAIIQRNEYKQNQ